MQDISELDFRPEINRYKFKARYCTLRTALKAVRIIMIIIMNGNCKQSLTKSNVHLPYLLLQHAFVAMSLSSKQAIYRWKNDPPEITCQVENY